MSNRDELYTDIKLNDTLCERYQTHMGSYDRNVLKSHEKVLTGSSDIGILHFTLSSVMSVTNDYQAMSVILCPPSIPCLVYQDQMDRFLTIRHLQQRLALMMLMLRQP